MRFLQCGHASAGAIESCTFDSEIYFSNSEHCRSVVSESGDLEWNENKIFSDEQEREVHKHIIFPTSLLQVFSFGFTCRFLMAV